MLIDRNDQYLCKTDYAINYNYKTKVANYVLERIEPSGSNNRFARTDNFREDEEIPEEFRSTLKDYANSGYDRGHLAPAKDFSANQTMMSESFLLSNMMPQLPSINRGVWKSIEENVRSWSLLTTTYVTTGTIYENNYTTIGNGVGVPNYMYKIIVQPKLGRSIAFVVENKKASAQPIENYIVSISEIEKKTGFDFNPGIPIGYAKIEEIKSNYNDWR